MKGHLEALCTQVDAAYNALSPWVDHPRDFTIQSESYGKDVKHWLRVMNHQKRRSLWSLFTEYEGNPIKIIKALEHWWENNHLTKVQKKHNAFK